MSLRLIGINGIKSDGSGNTDAALERLRPFGVQCVDTYHPMTRTIFQTRSRKRQCRDARMVKNSYYQAGDAVLAHSRGCLVSLRMMQMGARFSTLFWFRPALDRDFVIPENGCNRLFCIYSPGDRAIRLGSMLWFHDFGNAGRFGLDAGDPWHPKHDPRVSNICAPEYKRHEFWRHSDDFLPGNIDEWIVFMLARLSDG